MRLFLRHAKERYGRSVITWNENGLAKWIDSGNRVSSMTLSQISSDNRLIRSMEVT